MGSVRRTNTARRALFDDFIEPLASRNLGVHAKLAYELSVFFWRMAMWTVFEKHSGPGIVAMISPRAYISGPGHTGMREWMRHHANHIWIIDLGGDNRGARKSENIFEIETGVAIALCVKCVTPGARVANAIQYCEVTGSAVEKARRSGCQRPTWEVIEMEGLQHSSRCLFASQAQPATILLGLC